LTSSEVSPDETADQPGKRLMLGTGFASSAITFTDAPNATAIVMQSSSFLPTRTKVWLSGGTLGFTYALQNTVTTANGDKLIRTAKIQIKTK
jgi:hypothetical protein